MTRAVVAVLALAAAACDGPQLDLGADDLDLGLVVGPGASCFLSTAGSQLRCVGRGERGQLSRDPALLDERCAGAPCTTTALDGGLVAAQPMVLGLEFGCAARPDDTQCFGDARFGQLGTGERDGAPHWEPGSIGLPYAPRVLVAGRNHACVIDRDGAVWCWGDGSHGQLGRDPSTLDDCGPVATAADAERLALPIGATVRCSATPLQVSGFRDTRGLWAGGWATCLRDGDGDLRCAGLARAGALPVDGADRDVIAFTRVAPAFTDAVELALGPRHGCARFADDAVRCFGDGPAAAAAPGRALAVAVGDAATYLVRADHSVDAVGLDEHGELGDGPAAPDDCAGVACARTPVAVALPRHAVLVRAGGRHACALLSDRRVACWGDGGDGALGDPLLEDAPAPRLLDGLAPRSRRAP